jgi:hypothetical protein
MLIANRNNLSNYAEAIKTASRDELEAECLELATKLKDISDIENRKKETREFLHMWFD